MIISIEDFLSLRKHLPALDVRSEGEFQEGHIRHAINIPLLNNEERIAVGTDYKSKDAGSHREYFLKLSGHSFIPEL